MPFIRQEYREPYEEPINTILSTVRALIRDAQASDLAYVIFALLKKHYGIAPQWYDKADALKVLEDVKLQYYEDVLKPHAELKKQKNGDV